VQIVSKKDRSNYFDVQDNKSWIIEPQLNYHQQVGKGHIDIILGSTFQQNTYGSIGNSAYGFVSDALIPNPVAAATTLLANFSQGQYAYNALYGRIGYNYQEKYLLNFTGRRDGSSRFGPNKQFGNFGSIGAGWVFSKEKLIQNDLSWLSFGKIRFSFGSVGNDQLTDYRYLDTYTPNGVSYQGVSGLTPLIYRILT